MSFTDYLEQFLSDVLQQKEDLFTNEIRLSKTYSNMHGNITALNEDEKELLTLHKEFLDVHFFLKTKQYRDDINLANEKIALIKNLFKEISELVEKIEWK